jgi:hypothetical protein
MGGVETINLFDLHNFSNQKVLLTYKGPFDRQFIKDFGEKIKILTKGNPKESKKIFTLFIELTQNVANYSDEQNILAAEANTGVGTLIIGETDDKYIFGTGNVVANRNIATLQKKCDLINSLDREELQKYKFEQLNLIPGTNGRAHIGLVMVNLYTNQPLNLRISKINNSFSYFSIIVDIKKNT